MFSALRLVYRSQLVDVFSPGHRCPWRGRQRGAWADGRQGLFRDQLKISRFTIERAREREEGRWPNSSPNKIKASSEKLQTRIC